MTTPRSDPPHSFEGARAGETSLILASASAARQRMLANAGVAFEQRTARVDEQALKDSFRAEGHSVDDAALALAELKAAKISQKSPDALVIGADQILEIEGHWLDKPRDLDDAAASLRQLSGRRHTLISAVCVVRGGQRIWHVIDRARLTVREIDDRFIEHYLDQVGSDALNSVGAYKLEALGAHLFSRVEGDYFTILGMPLLPLLGFLREHEVTP